MSQWKDAQELNQFLANKKVIIGGVGVLWLLFVFIVFVSYNNTGGFENSLTICVPFMVIFHCAALALYLLKRKEDKQKRLGKPGVSGMFFGALALLAVTWVVFILMFFFIPDIDPEKYKSAQTTCIPIQIIITILCVMFVVYEVRKPWKGFVFPTDDPGAETFFEARTIINSRKTDYIRWAIVTLIGLSITLGIIALPVYNQRTGTVQGSQDFLIFAFTIAIPALMLIIIMLFPLYVASKKQDWINYLKALKEKGKPLPKKLSIDENKDPKLIDFDWQEELERKHIGK